MYQLKVFFWHFSEERVRESCDRVASYLRRAIGRSPTFSIDPPDDSSDEYLSRGLVEVSDRQFVGVISECLREEYCSARVLFVKKSYSPEEGVVEGNVWGVMLSGPLDDVYRIAKRLKQPAGPMATETKVTTRSTRYSHLRLVE